MPKINYKTNWRVEVEPEYPRFADTPERIEASLRSTCEGILDSVKRHVDDVSYIYIKYDVERKCSYCGSPWSEDSDTYNGGCCDPDEQHNPEYSTNDVQASEPAGETK